MNKVSISIGFVLASLSAACATNASTAPSSTTPTPASPTVTETFVGALPVGGVKFYSFSVSAYGTVNATLVSIGGDGVPPTVTVNLGIGTPSGTTCSVSSPTMVQVGGTAQVTATEQPGVYCATISDIGNLAATGTFTVTIDHP